MPTVETTNYNEQLPRDGQYEKLPPRDSANYSLEPVEDSPVGGHQVQVLHAEEEE